MIESLIAKKLPALLAVLLILCTPAAVSLHAATAHGLLPIAQMTTEVEDDDGDAGLWGLLGLLGLIGLAGLKRKDDRPGTPHGSRNA